MIATKAKASGPAVPAWLNLDAIGIGTEEIAKIDELIAEVVELDERIRPLMTDCRSVLDAMEAKTSTLCGEHDVFQVVDQVVGVDTLRAALSLLRERVSNADHVLAESVSNELGLEDDRNELARWEAAR